MITAEIRPGYPVLDQACRGPVAEPTQLVVTSTDFNTGAVGLVDLDTRTVAPDLALASSDALPFVDGGRVFVVNRYGFDYIDELDPSSKLALLHEWPVDAASVVAPSNPHALVLGPDGRAWVSLHGAPEVQAFRFPTLQAAQVAAELALDLSSFADADGVPELSAMIACGALVFVSAERIDRNSWVPVDETFLVPLALGDLDDPPTAFEFDPDHPGPDGVPLLGTGVGPWRLDPDDPSAHTLLLLNSGLERVDLATGATTWVVDEAVFEAAGYDRLQLSGFDLDDQGRIFIAAAADPSFAEFELLRVDLDGDTPELVVEVAGLQSVTGAIEIVGHEAWFADTTVGASGLRVFDLSVSPVVELPESPIPVGLPPMSLAPL